MTDQAYESVRQAIIDARQNGAEQLHVGPTGLLKLPPEIGQLSSLELLDLSGNALITLPAEIGSLKNLRSLNLTDNHIEHLPRDIINLANLRSLDLSGNRLSWLGAESSFFLQLAHLNLSKNRFKEFPFAVISLLHLKFLDISINQISSIPREISILRELRELRLDRNRLMILPREIGRLRDLEVLSLNNNLLTHIPPEIAQIPRLIIFDLRKNQLIDLPQELGGMLSLIHGAGQYSPFNGGQGLVIDGNPLPPIYHDLISNGQPTATINTLAFLRGEIYNFYNDTTSNNASVAPEIPPQQIGVHFESDVEGVIASASPDALVRDGNNIGLLRQLHPVLRDLVCDLVRHLSAGNAPHAHLRARAEAYQALIDTTLDNINFARLFVEGIRLANAYQRINAEISTGDLPSLNGETAENITSVLQIHGPFMLATQEGMEIIAAEERHRRRPNEEREYRAAAIDFAASLQDRPDIAQPDAADTILGAAEQAGLGPYPERSAVIGMGTVRNATIALTASAMTALFPILGQAALLAGGAATGIAGWFALLAANETVKNSAYFKVIVSRAAKSIDDKMPLPQPDAATARLLAGTSRVLAFVLSIEPKLRRLEKASGDQSWLGKTLDWMKDNASQPEKH